MSNTGSGFAENPNPFNFDFSAGVIQGTVEEYRRFGEEFGKDAMDKLMRISDGYLALSKSCVSMQYCYSRSGSAKSSSSVVSSVGSDGRSGKSVGVSISQGLMKTRLEAIGRLKSWRASSALPDGFCYAKLLKGSVSDSFVTNLGAHPTLATLSRISLKKFRSLRALERFEFVNGPGDKQVHVSEGTTDGIPVLRAVKSYVGGDVDVLVGSLGEAVSKSDVVPSDRKFCGDLRVGGGVFVSVGSDDSDTTPPNTVRLCVQPTASGNVLSEVCGKIANLAVCASAGLVSSSGSEFDKDAEVVVHCNSRSDAQKVYSCFLDDARLLGGVLTFVSVNFYNGEKYQRTF